VFPGRIALLRATDLDSWLKVADPSGTWGALCKQPVEVISMNCRHLDICKGPNVTGLVSHIDKVLVVGI
jgi:hypothetical protein